LNLITVIPARGASKSIPLKNIQPLNGLPLLAYSISYSLACPLVSHTVVSTDSCDIGDIALKHGAEVPFMRPIDISGDTVPDFPVIEHALIELEKIYQKSIDAIVWLRPTSPLRPSRLIEMAAKILDEEPQCTSVRAVVSSSEHPYRQWVSDGKFISGYVDEVYEPYNLPRQALPTTYFQSGDIEVVRRQTILDGSISGRWVMPLIINRDEMLDIDHMKDLVMAENRINERS
jgi:CMP-N,N'-diacetyllegionaminic acid synthase